MSLAFIEHEKLPSIGQKQQHLLVVLFGRTGEPGNELGKKILLGTLTHGPNGNTVSFVPLIGRKPEVGDKLGHPLGIAVDPQTKDIYFGDIIEGRMYKAQIGGENK